MMEHLKKFIFVTALLSVFVFHGSVFAEPDAIVTVKPGSGINHNPVSDDASRIGSYRPLVQLPGIPEVIDPGLESGEAGSFTLPQYIRTIVRIAIGVIGVLAVVMIVVAGVQYMGSDMITEKESAKSRLMGAVFGLILALSSVLILRTINPQLTNLSIGDERFRKGVDGVANTLYIPKELDIEGDAGTSATYGGLSSLPNGVYCPKPASPQKNQVEKIATSFKGKNTYRYGGGHSKNEPPFPSEKSSWMCDGKQCRTFCPEGTSCLDCSAFVNQVLECAGFKRFEGTTAAMVSSSKSERVTAMTTTTANGKVLNPGDLLFYNGHVVIYIGNGKTAESFGGSTGRKPGNSIAIQDADAYFKKGKKMYVYRAQ